MTSLTYGTIPAEFLTPISVQSANPREAARNVWQRIKCLTPLAKFKRLCRAPQDIIDVLDTSWEVRARPDQLPPDITQDDDDWLIWLLLGGRGSGKTRAGAEWVTARVANGALDIALVGPSINEVREVMIEGESGLMNVGARHNRPTYISSRRRLEWPSGAVGHVFSSEDPESLRGWNFDTAWADEFCAWPNPEGTLSNLRFATRKKGHLGLPKIVVTTTRKATKALKNLLSTHGLVRSNSRTLDNADNLAPGFVIAMKDTYGGTRRGREELNGEYLEEHEGAIWKRADLDRANLPTNFTPQDYKDVILTIDPPITTGKNANACGIIIAAKVRPNLLKPAHVVVLHDGTVQGTSPTVWATHAMRLAADFQVTRVVVEANQGGDLVRTVLRRMGENMPINNVWAHRSKDVRALSVVHHYETGRVHHENIFPELEEELAQMGAANTDGKATHKKSPDRADALIWAILELLPKGPRQKLKYRIL